MNRHHALAWAAFSVSAVISIASASAQHAAGQMSDQDLIKSAMSAAPPAVAEHASVVTVSADGTMKVLRKGDNGFTCLPDSPSTPGPDPMCADQNAMEWVKAWLERKPPPANKVGFLYMLAGGTDASNTDPYAEKPEANNNWVETGPHVMVVGAKGMMEGYPRTPKPDTSQPYVMWADTPYEHLMLPVHMPEHTTR
ncbi:hypothetical protein [Microvirga subterranea]|uniref:Secreted protein n=1 Tax=Microvirga subterranea TaxID=186651 RepID=A0A370HTZ8_9HYPH|nr:hypothetical protein [Microvirga subterranea]RDI62013.1 hypothetical protein DES45_101276 [Microvirga subterranea]